MSEEAQILVRVDGHLGRLTLNRPRALNALTGSMCETVQHQLGVWSKDPKIRSVVVDAVPGRAFCAGGDIRAVYDWGRQGDPRALAFFTTEYRMNAAIGRFAKPAISLLDGIVMGGGAGISMHGDYRVVTEKCLFAMPEAAIGLIPDVGASHFLSRCPGAIGPYLGLTGARLRASDLLYAGLATHYVPSEKLGGIVAELASGAAADMVLARYSEEPEDSGESGQSPLSVRRETIDHVFSPPDMAEILVRITQAGAWGGETSALIAKGSPTSLKLTRRLLSLGRGQDLEACLRLEWAIVREILKGHDLYEGIRALLIDKDQRPNWVPGRLEDVPDHEIAKYFPGPGLGDSLDLGG